MLPINPDEINLEMYLPNNVNENDVKSINAYESCENGQVIVTSIWQPSKEDKEAIAAGRPIFLKQNFMGYPLAMYTKDENGEPNL